MHYDEERHLRNSHQSFSRVVLVQSVDGSSFFPELVHTVDENMSVEREPEVLCVG